MATRVAMVSEARIGEPALQPGLPSEPDGPDRCARPVPSAPSGAEDLRLGGLTPMTTTDYPGELAATVFCQGCPWRCHYCHNAHLVDPAAATALTWAEVRNFLIGRRGLIDAVVFSGGEPTAQAALPSAIAEVRELGFKVGLHTGGPYPDRLARILPSLDWVGLDIKALPADYALVTGVPGSGEPAWESLALAVRSGVELEVRTTPLPGVQGPDDLIDLMGALASAGVRRYALQQCRPHSLLDPTIASYLPVTLPIAPIGLFEQFSRRDG